MWVPIGDLFVLKGMRFIEDLLALYRRRFTGIYDRVQYNIQYYLVLLYPDRAAIEPRTWILHLRSLIFL
jgi:hypothetical protein